MDEEGSHIININDKKKTILFVSHDANYSGASFVLKECFDEWCKTKNFDIICLFPGEGAFKDYCEKIGIKTYSTKYWFWTLEEKHHGLIDYAKLLLKLLISYINVRRCIHKNKIENVSCVYSNSSVIPEGAWISKFLHVPHIWHAHEYCVGVHDSIPVLGKAGLHRYMNKHADKIITVSKSLYGYFTEDIPADKLEIVYNDIPKKYEFNNEPWESVKHEGIIIGSYTKGKHQDLALDAVDILNKNGTEFNLTMIGGHNTNNEDYYDGLKKECSQEIIRAHTTMLGEIKDIDAYRKKCGIAVIASEYESFGRVTVESMLSGLIVVANNSGASPEIITDGVNGFLFDCNNAGSLAEKINKIINMDENTINKLRNDAVLSAKKFTGGKCHREIEKIIDGIIDHK